ncbi:MAG: dephospho-CoA kinase [Elusimicrobia bacterium]|nr:dephospho-CoA kinase [Elusimicrobiota bacterium]
MIFGLTGGIASGKSTVLNQFAHLGAKIIESDRIAHDIYAKGKPVYKKIIKQFGREVLNAEKNIDRRKLGKIVFSNQSQRKKLEKITHPEIIAEIKNQINRFKRSNKVIMVDAPLLFEAKLQKMFDKIIVVWIPEKVQIQRLIKRDKITKAEAQKRLSAQISLDKKKKIGDYVIDNSGSPAATAAKIKCFWQVFGQGPVKPSKKVTLVGACRAI